MSRNNFNINLTEKINAKKSILIQRNQLVIIKTQNPLKIETVKIASIEFISSALKLH